ncbi:MAG: abortive infection system antitoxin AbiGi family protein [Peptococcaceae bacterium]
MQRYYSNIYWHFTGSPENLDWEKIKSPDDILKFGRPKEDKQAADILLKIIKNREIIANTSEKISNNFYTEKFCCVTDVPLKDLLTHGPYYGKVALGFKPRPIHENFVPVLYISENNLPFAGFITSEFQAKRGRVENYDAYLKKAKEENPAITMQDLAGFITNFIKVTKFDVDEGHSFYREREWRHLGNFRFTYNSIEAVVVPQKFLEYVKEELAGIKELLEISYISWEFLQMS